MGCTFLLLLVLCVTCGVSQENDVPNKKTMEKEVKVPVLEYSVRVIESAGLYNHLILPNTTNITSCYVTINDTIVIDLDNGTSKIDTNGDEEITTRVSSLGHGLCGLKYVNATMKTTDSIWILKSTDDKGHSYTGTFYTHIESRSPPYSKAYAKLGQTHTIYCWTLEERCTIHNPQGELVETKRCVYKINTVTMKDIGTWTCFAEIGLSMEAVASTFDLIELKEERYSGIMGWSNETENYVTVQCEHHPDYISSCKMILPNNVKVLNVSPGFATDRYLSLGTSFEESRCGLTIQKPLQGFEKGVWRCELDVDNKITSTFITVGGEESIEYPKYREVTTRIYESLTINCEVPYPTDYCRIESPSGNLFSPNDEDQLSIGVCSYHIQNVTSYDDGDWTCHIARKTGLPDEKITIHVAVADILQGYSKENVAVGDTAEIMCSTKNIPLGYCRFESPEGVRYHVRDYDNDSSGISYFGRGLKYGECGIKIPNTKVADIGVWKCIVQLLPNKRQETEGRIYLFLYHKSE